MITEDRDKIHREYISRLKLREVNYDVEKLYKEKEKQYSDSWRDMPIFKMINRLTEEYEELKMDITFGVTNSTYKECLDVINVAKMLAYLVKEKEKKNER